MEYLLTQYSILILSVFLLIGVAIRELCLSATHSPTRNWLLIHLSATALFLGALFIDDGSYTMGARPFYILEYPAVLLSAMSFSELCYSVTSMSKTRHHTVYRWAVAGLTVLWIAAFLNTVLSGADYAEPSYTILLTLPIALFCWPIALFIKRLHGKAPMLISAIIQDRTRATLSDQEKSQLGFLLACTLGSKLNQPIDR